MKICNIPFLSVFLSCFCPPKVKIENMKIHWCDVMVFTGIVYKAPPTTATLQFSLEDCVTQCLQTPECKWVNYKGLTCTTLRTGIVEIEQLNSRKNLKEGKMAQHALITCVHKPPTDPVECGKQAQRYKPNLPSFTRIVGGPETKPHSWPWMLNHLADTGRGMGFGCGAVLLQVKNNRKETDIMLTAGHCVNDFGEPLDNGTKAPIEVLKKWEKVTIPATRVYITAGQHNVSTYEEGEQWVMGADLRVHPEFRKISHEKRMFRNDLVVIKLAQPIKFSDTVLPICLPKQNEPIPVGRMCIAAGWGRNIRGNREPSAVLNQLLMPANDAETCKKAWNGQKIMEISGKEEFIYDEKQMICVGKADTQHCMCSGDCGSQLACKGDDGRWVLQGIMSSLENKCCVENRPEIFSRVASYVDWIQQSINEMTSL